MPSPSGQPLPLGDLLGWRQIFVDDFDVPVPLGSWPTAVAGRWWAYPEWKDTSKNGVYSPGRVVSVHDGLLDKAIRTNSTGTHLVAALLPKLDVGPHQWGAGLRAGRFAVRFKADALPCYKTAWLLWPDSGQWPRDGEIDFPEGALDGEIHGFMHRQGATVGSDQASVATGKTYATWHTAVIEWVGGVYCDFYFDGVLIKHITDRVPNTPMHWVLQTETALQGCVPANATSGHVLIDWVAVWIPKVESPMTLKIAEVKAKLDAVAAAQAKVAAAQLKVASANTLMGAASAELALANTELTAANAAAQTVIADLQALDTGLDSAIIP